MDYKDPGVEESSKKDNIIGGDIQYHLKVSDENKLILGLEIRGEKAKSSVIGDKKITTTSRYIQDEIQIRDNLIANLGIRFDKHSRFGYYNSPRIGIVYVPFDDTFIRVSCGKAFRAPTLNDLYWPKTAWAEGNPDLSPEKGWGLDIEVEHKIKDISGKFCFFYTNIKDLIDWTEFDDGIWRPENIDEALIKGAELEADYKILKNLSSSLTYNYLHAKDSKTKRWLTYRPLNALNLKLEYFDEKIGIKGNLIARYKGKRYTNKSNTKKLGGFWTIDSKITKTFSKKHDVSFEIKNILHKKYQEVYDYPMPETIINLELNYKF
jgi:vitamin B12 transporter